MMKLEDVIVLEKDKEIKEILRKDFNWEKNLGWMIKNIKYCLKYKDNRISFSTEEERDDFIRKLSLIGSAEKESVSFRKKMLLL